MNEDKYERTIDELETHACKWWPQEVRDEAQKVSILPVLLNSQEKFISILKLANKEEPLSLFSLIDVGNGPFEYEFSALPIAGVLNNKRMKTDTSENLSDTRVNVPLCKDLIMLLTFGGAAVEANVHSIFFRCTPYEYLGDDVKVETFVRQNYIRVSKIISGKMASDLGNGAQQYVVKYLTRSLGNNYCVRSNGTIPGVTQNDGDTLTNFDVVVDRVDDSSRHKKYVAIEVTFQETTNSTIERKGGQARDRFEKIVSSRNYIAYIIDGAGNFARRSAVSVLCENSHCTVAYTPEEFQLLTEFIKERIG